MTSSVMNYQIHGSWDESSMVIHDYWRFTPEGFRSLLAPFAECVVDSLGERGFPHTVIGMAFKGPVPEYDVETFRGRLAGWKRRWGDGTPPWIKMLKLFLPPILASSLGRCWDSLRARGKPCGGSCG